MISEEEMKKAEGHIINITYTNKEKRNNVRCDCFHIKQEDDEENMLEIGNFLVFQSDIEKIEVLD